MDTLVIVLLSVALGGIISWWMYDGMAEKQCAKCMGSGTLSIVQALAVKNALSEQIRKMCPKSDKRNIIAASALACLAVDEITEEDEWGEV